MKNLLSTIALSLLISACNNTNQQAATQSAKKEILDSVNTAAMVNATRQRTIDSMNQVSAEKQKAIHHEQHQQTAAAAPVAQKKKGMSNTGKGALIGTGAGAVSGALAGSLIDKNKGQGAVVGGLIGAAAGAGVGALTGKKMDKKKQEEDK